MLFQTRQDKESLPINENFDLQLGGIFIGNTGFGYGTGKDNVNASTADKNHPIIRIIDKDTGEENGEVKATVLNGRIVNVEVINSGKGFLRIPRVEIIDKNGFGSKLFPVMSLVPKNEAKAESIPVKMIFCPGKNQRNSI